jgi:membrane-anchored protein YejM (alkaline phosphatase superfamily)
VLTVDAALGDFLDRLAGRSGWDGATVVFTADHGEEFWEYGGYEHGTICNGVVTRVPLILKAPGVKPGRNDSVVSLADLFPLFVDGAGDLLHLARSGSFEPGRVAFSEDTLYTDPQASAVTDDLRATFNLKRHGILVLPLDANGDEPRNPSLDPVLAQRAKALGQKLGELRGGMEPTRARDGVAIPNSDTFDKLRSLGYLE